METEAAVEFRNVARSYFPQSRVDCHYTLSSGHTWTSGDWVGLFKAGWSSTKDYQTFVWALAPAGCQEPTKVNCCVQFQASYLPRPSGQEYEFVYVAANGEDCFRSSRFTFCTPKPLDDLVTLEEEPHGEGDSTDIVLVVPRAELLKRQLRECLREQAELLGMQEEAKEQKEKEGRDFDQERLAWSRLREELHSDISGLQDELRRSQEKVEELERWQKEETVWGECLAEENRALVEVKEANRLQIEQLQEDIKTLTQRALQGEMELERIKESAKRTAEEEEMERQILQNKLEQTQGDLRSLSKEFQEMRTSRAQRDTSVLQLQNTISSLSQKLSAAYRKEALNEATLKEMRSLQERLDASERAADVLKNDLSSTADQRDRGQTEVHQARLQAAQLTLQLADCSLALREGRAQWAQEKQSLQRKAEKAREDLENLTAEMQTIEEKLQEERTERMKLEVELGRKGLQQGPSEGTAQGASGPEVQPEGEGEGASAFGNERLDGLQLSVGAKNGNGSRCQAERRFHRRHLFGRPMDLSAFRLYQTSGDPDCERHQPAAGAPLLTSRAGRLLLPEEEPGCTGGTEQLADHADTV